MSILLNYIPDDEEGHLFAAQLPVDLVDFMYTLDHAFRLGLMIKLRIEDDDLKETADLLRGLAGMIEEI